MLFLILTTKDIGIRDFLSVPKFTGGKKVNQALMRQGMMYYDLSHIVYQVHPEHKLADSEKLRLKMRFGG